MTSEKEKMLRSELYMASDPELVAERIEVRKWLNRLNTMIPEHDPDYTEVVHKVLPNCDPNVVIQPPFYCDYGYNISCGENTMFNFDCVVLDVARVTIGRNGFFAPKVQIYTAGHPIDSIERGQMLEYGKPVTIGDDCWIGGGSVICPGVTIGDRVVIGAGSVVAKDIPSDSVAVGNPARVIRKLA